MEPCSVILGTPRKRIGNVIAKRTSVDAYMDPFNGIQLQIGWRVRNVKRIVTSSLRTPPRGDR